MNRITLVLALGATAALAEAPRPAQAMMEVGAFWGPTVAVEMVVATQVSTNSPVVIFRRLSDSRCEVVSLGAVGGGLSDDLQVYGSDGNDQVILAGSDGRVTCRMMNGAITYFIDYRALALDGFQVMAHGLGGNDTMSNTGLAHPNYINLYGYGGNDRITTTIWNTKLIGDEGNDTLIGLDVAATNEYYNGGEGDDCIDDRSKKAVGYDCGFGADRFVPLDEAIFVTLCEQPVASCS